MKKIDLILLMFTKMASKSKDCVFSFLLNETKFIFIFYVFLLDKAFAC